LSSAARSFIAARSSAVNVSVVDPDVDVVLLIAVSFVVLVVATTLRTGHAAPLLES